MRHDGVAHDQRRGDLPGEQVQREIPRRHDTDDLRPDSSVREVGFSPWLDYSSGTTTCRKCRKSTRPIN